MASMEMRQVVNHAIAAMMREDDRIVVLDADLSKAVGTKSLYKDFPNRAFNIGIAEANMVSVAAGLATYGFIPLTFTFAPFSSRRVCDQVALSVCFAKRNVKLFGCDPGITAQINGATHMGNDDIGVLRSIPDLVIVDPCDTASMQQLLPQIVAYSGPVYVRLLRKECPQVYTQAKDVGLFQAEIVREGAEVTLFASGLMVAIAIQAADALEQEGIRAEVIDVHTIKPLDAETVVASIKKTGAAVTCENHNVLGGLGSAVAEIAAKNHPVPVEFIGVQDHFGQAANQAYLLEKFGMAPDDIVSAAHRAIARKGK